MTKPILTALNKLQSPCVCFFANSLAKPVKDILINTITVLVASATAIITFLKTIGTLITNIDKEIKIYAMQTALNFEKTLVRPLESPFALLTKMAKPYVDCDYINTFLTGVRTVRSFVFDPVDKQMRKFEDMIDQLEDEKKKWDQLDNVLSIMTDFKNAISSYCGTD